MTDKAVEILRIVKTQRPELWCRPVGWVGEAIMYQPQRGWLRVPTSRGGEPARLSPDEFMKPWEAVTSEIVIAERMEDKADE